MAHSIEIYNWQKKDWPFFRYSLRTLEDKLLLIAEKTGKLSGFLNALPDNLKMETVLGTAFS